jgi:hypothetical protein
VGPRWQLPWWTALPWAAAVFFVTVPPAVQRIGASLDESWLIGLTIGARVHRQWGSQIVFTYGPLGYLDFTRFVFFDLWSQAFLVTIAIHVVFVGALVLLLVQRQAGIQWWILLGLVVLLPLYVLPSLEHECVLATFVLLVIGATANDERLRILGAVGAGILVGFLALVKGTSLLSGTALIAVFASFAVWRGMARPALAAVVTALVTFAILWLVAGQAVAGVPQYVRAELQVIAGYSPAMSVDGSSVYPPRFLVAQIWASALVFALTLGQVGWAAVRRDWAAFRILLMALPVLFVYFKEGFVRFGANQVLFYGTLVLVEALVLIALASRRGYVRNGNRQMQGSALKSPALAVPSLLVLMVTSVMLTVPGLASYVSNLEPRWTQSTLNDRLATYGDALRLLKDGSARSAVSNDTHKNMQGIYRLTPRQLADIGSNTMDVLPWDIGIVYAYGLNYHPRPVLQSYVANTTYLDLLDAASLQKPDAPLRILASYQTLDDRYAAFDEPAAFRAILENYSVIGTEPSALVLSKHPPRSYQDVAVANEVSEIGRLNRVPVHGPGTLYARVQVEYSPVGRVAGLLYKPAPAYITLDDSKGGHSTHRFVSAVAGDGLFMSTFMDTNADFANAIEGRFDNPITSFTVTVGHPLREYERAIKIEYWLRRPAG